MAATAIRVNNKNAMTTSTAAFACLCVIELGGLLIGIHFSQMPWRRRAEHKLLAGRFSLLTSNLRRLPIRYEGTTARHIPFSTVSVLGNDALLFFIQCRFGAPAQFRLRVSCSHCLKCPAIPQGQPVPGAVSSPANIGGVQNRHPNRQCDLRGASRQFSRIQ